MSLPCDIIFEILLRLRVETLFRFQCVSKSWKTMISDPAFRKAHRCRAEQNPLIFNATTDFEDLDSGIIELQTWDKRGTLIKKSVETRISSWYWGVKTCLDLVCINNRCAAIILNPATEESILLPLPKTLGRPIVAVGFGYVSSTKVFKVLHVYDTYRPGPNKHRCEIFTLCVDDQWRAAPAVPSCVRTIDNCYIPFVNRAIHFLPIGWPEDVDRIVAFDLEREEWSMIPSPPVPNSRLSLFNLGGLLCALKCPRPKESRHFDIWLLKDYEQGLWIKEYNIDLSTFNYDLSTEMIPLAIEQDGRILIQVSMFDSSWLHYYDPKGKNHEQIKTPERWFRSKLYVEGFSSLGRQ